MKLFVNIFVFALTLVGIFASANADTPPQFLLKWGTSGSGQGQFNGPLDVDVDNQGFVYVADTENHRIQKFTAQGQYVTAWGTYGSSDGQFKYPTGVCADNLGHIFVADGLNNRIQKFSDSGVHLLSWGSLGSGHGQFDHPNTVATDAVGNVYVGDSYNLRVEQFTSDGQYLLTFDVGYGNSQDAMDGIAVSSSGSVFTTDPWLKIVQEFTLDGHYVNAYGCSGGYPTPCAFSHPNDVALDAAGNFYVVDNDWFRVVKWSPGGSVLTLWGTNGTGDGQFDQPYGIAVNKTTGWVYVAEEFNNRIQVFGDNSTPVRPTTWGSIKALYK